MSKEYNIVELFSGIGSQARALKNLGVKINAVATCEWDYHAFIGYDIIHNSPKLDDEVIQMTKEELLECLKPYTISTDGKRAMKFSLLKSYSVESLRYIWSGITRSNNFVDICSLNGKDLPNNIDLMTYSFPCQDLSFVGAFHGYNKGIDKDSGSRSSLLWQVGRILQEMKDSSIKLPRFLLMENVPALLSKRHRDNFEVWKHDLERLGYFNQHYELNARDFGQAQNRPRLLMISVYVGNDIELKEKVTQYFDERQDAQIVVEDYKKTEHYTPKTISELIRVDYTNEKILAEAIEATPNDTVSRRKIRLNNPQIVKDNYVLNDELSVVRTITTKQDRHPNSGTFYFDMAGEGMSKFRYLTPRECLLFMGFTDEDYDAIKSANIHYNENAKTAFIFPRDKIYHMAGNSIPVKLLEGIFLQILKIDKKLLKSKKKYRKKCHK